MSPSRSRKKGAVSVVPGTFKPDKYADTYRKELMDLIRAKAKGRKLPEPQEEDDGEVIDLMAALRESVEQTKQQKRKAPPRKRTKKAG